MLIQFTFENFLSFAKETTINMQCAPISEHDYNVIHDGKNKYLKIAVLYGANASGKSNVLSAFDFMSNYILNSLQFAGTNEFNDDNKNIKDAPVAVPFIFSKHDSNKPTLFEVFFKIKDRTYQYGFLIKSNKILEEWLFYRTRSGKIFHKIFERTKNEIVCEKLIKNYQQILNISIEEETLVLSLGAKLKISVLKQIYKWFYMINIINFGDESENLILSRILPSDIEKEECRKNIVKFLNGFDPSIKEIELEKVKSEDSNKYAYNVFTYHKEVESNKFIKIPMTEESSGTQKMFSLYVFFDYAFKNGSILFADELNARLHPLLMRNIIEMFHDENINKNNAQLIFTTHDISLLKREIFRRDEIWFTEKDENGRSKLYSLVDFKLEDGKVRKDANFSKDYLNGKYGAIPELKLFNMIGDNL